MSVKEYSTFGGTSGYTFRLIRHQLLVLLIVLLMNLEIYLIKKLVTNINHDQIVELNRKYYGINEII